MKLQEQWEIIHMRLRKLDGIDDEEEERLLSQAYESLMAAYQESRSLNREMEFLLQDV